MTAKKNNLRQMVEESYRRMKGRKLTAVDQAAIDQAIAQQNLRDVQRERQRAELARAMGVTLDMPRPRVDGTRQVFPTLTREQGIEWLRSRGA